MDATKIAYLHPFHARQWPNLWILCEGHDNQFQVPLLSLNTETKYAVQNGYKFVVDEHKHNMIKIKDVMKILFGMFIGFRKSKVIVYFMQLKQYYKNKHYF